VYNRDNPQGLFVRRVGNQIVADQKEPQRPGTEVRASVALMGKSQKPANGIENLRHDPVGGIPVFLRNVIAYASRSAKAPGWSA
jgi:hypothetical protein